MTEKCFDEGTIQAFLDGELGLELVDRISHHIALCDSCALAVAEAEDQMEFAFSALDTEFNTLVPTERLWTKINLSIETEAKNKSIWHSLYALLTNPSSLAFASLVIVFGLFVGLYGLKNTADNTMLAKTAPKPKLENITAISNSPVKNPPSASTANDKISQPPSPVLMAKQQNNAEDFRARKVVYVETERSPIKPDSNYETDIVYATENLAAEESYIKTISTLEKTVNNRKDEVLNPSARFAFEKDLAVTDNTIENLKKEVRKNPKNEAARVLLRNSYQNKIDLLNSLAEKTELMASLN